MTYVKPSSPMVFEPSPPLPASAQQLDHRLAAVVAKATASLWTGARQWFRGRRARGSVATEQKCCGEESVARGDGEPSMSCLHSGAGISQLSRG